MQVEKYQPKDNSKNLRATSSRRGLRRLNSEKLIKFNMLKHAQSGSKESNQNEDSKDYEMIDSPRGENNTSDSTPDKSMIESSEDQELIGSFCLPDDDQFQIEFRNKNMLMKTDSDSKVMRNKFLQKLAQERIWMLPNEKPKSHQSCIIFDWDDTLICTSFLNPNGVANDDPVPESYQEFLSKLEEVVIDILTVSLKHSRVYIITNAAQGWVEFSSRKYMPKVHKMLDKLTVVSARSQYEIMYPRKSKQWKMHAFLDTMRVMERGAVTNLVAIGDSNIEMEASKHLAKKFPRALLKTVKFRESPSPDELIKQLMLVNQRMDNI